MRPVTWKVREAYKAVTVHQSLSQILITISLANDSLLAQFKVTPTILYEKSHQLNITLINPDIQKQYILFHQVTQMNSELPVSFYLLSKDAVPAQPQILHFFKNCYQVKLHPHITEYCRKLTEIFSIFQCS